MERAHLIRLERADDSVEDTAIVEQNEVLLAPAAGLMNIKNNAWFSRVRTSRVGR